MTGLRQSAGGESEAGGQDSLTSSASGSFECSSAFLCTGGCESRSKLQGKDVKFRFEIGGFGPDEIRRGSALARDTPRELRCGGGGICQRACGIRGVVEAMAVVKMD